MKPYIQFYVDAEIGDDSAFGTVPTPDGKGNAPFRTLERAVTAAHEVRISGSAAPITVFLCTDIPLTSPAVIDLFTGGPTRGNDRYPLSQVTFTSFGGRKKIVGGVEIKEWKEDTLNGVSCYSAHVPGGVYFEDLFVNGKPAKRCRFPADGSTLTALQTENEQTGLFDKVRPSHWFIARKEDLASLPDIRSATVNFCHFWIDEHTPIRDFDEETGKVTLKLRTERQINTVYAKDGKPEHYAAFHYWLENVKSGFANPGEWYLDVENQTVYYIPTQNDAACAAFSAWIPLTGKLILVEGTKEKPIRGIHFRDIGFFCSKGEYEAKGKIYNTDDPDDPDDLVAADPQSACNAPGALEFLYAENCSVENCSLSCVGAHAIRIGDGCHCVRVEKSDISYISAGGVLIDGGDATEEPVTHTSNITVTDCHFSFLGRRYLAGCGILLKNACCCDLSHNEIHDLSYTGISVGWVWGFSESVSKENRISHNHIYRVGGGLLSDMGGIYTLGEQPGTVIENNLIHHVASSHYGGWGIYLDEGSSGITVRNNLVFGTGSTAVCQHYGRDNCVLNNILVAGKGGCFDFGRRLPFNNINYERNVFIAPELPEHPEELGTGLPADYLRDNVFLATKSAGKADAAAYGSNRIGTTSFVDPEADAFTVSDASLLDSVGFRLWNFRDVGPRKENN